MEICSKEPEKEKNFGNNKKTHANPKAGLNTKSMVAK